MSATALLLFPLEFFLQLYQHRKNCTVFKVFLFSTFRLQTYLWEPFSNRHQHWDCQIAGYLQRCTPKQDWSQTGGGERDQVTANYQVGAWSSEQKEKRYRKTNRQNWNGNSDVGIPHANAQWEAFSLFIMLINAL